MKIAITVSGEPRFCEEFNLFINRLKGYDQVDWYFFIWKESYSHTFYNFGLIAPNWRKVDYDWAFNKIKDHLPENHNLVKLVLPDQKDYESPDVSPNLLHESPNIPNVWKMYQSIKDCDALRNGQEYDLVIRVRPDMMLEQELDLRPIKNEIDAYPNRIVMPNNHWHGLIPVNDWFAISSPKNMTIYSSVIDHIEEYIRSRQIPFHPETLLGYHLLKNNLQWVGGNFGVDLRVLGTVPPNDRYQSNFSSWA